MSYLTQRIQDNPLAAQLTRGSRQPRKRRELALLTLFFSAGLIWLSSLTPPLSGGALYAAYYAMRRISSPFAWQPVDSLEEFTATLILVMLILPVAAAYAAVTVSRHAGTARLRELRVTPLEEKSIVQAYVWAALTRMPVVVALTAGLCVSLLVRTPFDAPRIFCDDQLSQLLYALLWLIAAADILVRLWLAVTVGVALVLWLRRSPILVGLYSMGVMLAVALAIMAVQSAWGARLHFPLTGLLAPLRNHSIKGILIFDILNGLVWTGVAAGLAAISVRWAKRGVSLHPR